MAEKEYIERNVVLEIVKRTGGDYAAAFSEVARIPAADVAAVVHGEWIPLDGDYADAGCSVCGEIMDVGESPLPQKELFDLFRQVYRYCPVCGARMDGENIALGG